MNKKINFLAIIPLWWSIILLLLLLIKIPKTKNNMKKFCIYFIASGLFGGLVINGITFVLFYVNSLVNINDFIYNYGSLIPSIIGGYLMNLFTFILINKKWNSFEWNDLEKIN